MLHTSDVPVPRVLGIAGSLRRRSWNRFLLAAASTSAASFLQLSLYHRLELVPLFNEDIEHPLPDGVRALREAVRNADGLLIATPEYNQSIPGVLKNAIDWLSREDSLLQAKPVAVIGASMGRWGTRLAQAALRQTLNATGAHLMPAPALFVAHAERSFDTEGRLHDARVAGELQQVTEALRSWVQLHAARSTAAAGPPEPAGSYLFIRTPS